MAASPPDYFGKLATPTFDAYWNQSPLACILNAKTHHDPCRRATHGYQPSVVELHAGAEEVGIPTELYMYPGDTHGIPDPRNRLGR
jgi:hypothetical protein